MGGTHPSPQNGRWGRCNGHITPDSGFRGGHVRLDGWGGVTARSGRDLGAGTTYAGLRHMLCFYDGRLKDQAFVATIANIVFRKLPPLLATGNRVQICDLIHSPQFNGVEGAVEGFDAVTGRYNVRVLGRSRPLRVRASNLVLQGIPHPDQPPPDYNGLQEQR
eukprot:COSAG01_NODE_5048_length_4525_cov_43.153547_2_plen_163_part_00